MRVGVGGGAQVTRSFGTRILRDMAAPTDVDAQVTYVIQRQLSSGGMSEVYEALQLGVNDFRKRVALKLLHPKIAEHEELLSNFIGEAKLVADLIHANIGQIYHLGRHEGRFYIAMELIDGVTLQQFALQHRDLARDVPQGMAVFVLSRVVRGLAYAHEKKDASGRSLGLVHRDVNPQNVMLSFEGDVKLMDFGVAKANLHMTDQEGELIAGKLEYMSPEQIGFQRTDHRSDIFSVCVTGLELLIGRPLFLGATVERTRALIRGFRVQRIFDQHPERFADEGLRAILVRGLAPDPADRYASTRELLVELERLIYATGYGPTNETLAEYLRTLFPERRTGTALSHTSPTLIVRE